MSPRLPLSLMPALVLALASAGCSTPPLMEGTATVSTLDTALDASAFALGPNDLVDVSVYGHAELSTPRLGNQVGTRVGPDGKLSLPLVGPVAVGGLNLDEARAAVTEAFRPYVNDPKVDLSVIEWSARRFYVYGEVKQPGAFVMDRPLTVYQGLSMSGGFLAHADRAEIALLRGTPEALEIHVIDGSTPDPSGLVALMPDDFLFVRRSGSGRFAQDVLPILSGIGSSLSSVATVLLIEDELSD